MGLDDIIDKIDKETQEEVDSILSRAREKAKEIREDNRREIEEELEDRRKKLERELRTHRNVYISDGKRKSRQAILTSKEEVIWDALSQIRKRMGELEGERLSSFIQSLGEEAKGSLGGNIKIYPVRRKDADSLVSQENIRGIIEEGIEGEPPLSRFRGRSLIGGFVAVSADNKKVLDMTFCGILSRDKERNREIIAKELFGSDEG